MTLPCGILVGTDALNKMELLARRAVLVCMQREPLLALRMLNMSPRRSGQPEALK